MFLGLLEWVALGLLVGFIMTKMVNLRGDDPRLGIGAAIGGAIVGAIIYTLTSGVGVSVWNPWCLVSAGGGAVAASVIWHVIRSRSISHAPYTSRRSY